MGPTKVVLWWEPGHARVLGGFDASQVEVRLFDNA